MIFTLLLLLPTRISANSDCARSSFFIEYSSSIPGRVLATLPVDGLHECARECAKLPACSSFHYLLDSSLRPHCQLLDPRQPGDAQLLPESVLYAGRKYCVAQNSGGSRCAGRPWSFERFAGRDLLDEKHTLHKQFVENAGECMQRCLESPNCRSCFFSKLDGLCRLSRLSLQAAANPRLLFSLSDEVDMYESNCFQGPSPSAKCSFLRLRNAGLPDHFDERVPAISVEECERRCAHRAQTGSVCRQYTFDSSSSLCLLGHTPSRLLGMSPLENHHHALTSGDLEDCVDFGLKCKSTSFEIRATSLRMFNGVLRAQNSSLSSCSHPINDEYHYSFEMPFDKCGIQLKITKESPFPTYYGVLQLKEARNLITIHDKTIQVHCRLHPSHPIDQSVSALVKPENASSLSPVSSIPLRSMAPNNNERSELPPLPRFSLSVLDSHGHPTDTMPVGEKGRVRVTVNLKRDEKGSTPPFSVSSLSALDSDGRPGLELIDDKGCANRSLITKIVHVSDREVDYHVVFDHFPRQSSVVFQAYIEKCAFDCAVECNKELEERNEDQDDLSENDAHQRRRRSFESSIEQTHSAKRIQLVHHKYKVIGRVRLVGEGDDDVHKKKMSPSLPLCVSAPSRCALLALLSAVQLFLIATAGCLLWMYCQQMRRTVRPSLVATPPPSPIVK